MVVVAKLSIPALMIQEWQVLEAVFFSSNYIACGNNCFPFSALKQL